jgi:hypothetical protein
MRSWFLERTSREEDDVEQRVSLVTLGVADLGRALSFYESLGGPRPAM